MEKYIGTKLIKAMPLDRGGYNAARGWTLPADENAEDEGYLVEYCDGGKPNLAGYEGYVSWSPKQQFDNAYRRIDAMTFGLAVEALKLGKKVARAGWNGKSMWLGLVEAYEYNPKADRAFTGQLGCEKLPWIGMKTADNKLVPWLASQADMLAEDWQIVE